MPGVNDQTGDTVERSRQAWQDSMLRQMGELHSTVQTADPHKLAARCGAEYDGSTIHLRYWSQSIEVNWPNLSMLILPDNKPLSVLDSGILMYYLYHADGTPMEDRWISYRELPDGGFYNQAFQGYSGDRLANAFAFHPESLHQAARELDGWPLTALPGIAYAFQALPNIRLAAIIYPGDDEFPTTARILFDAAASHYMPIYGLALLGSGLASRLIRKKPASD